MPWHTCPWTRVPIRSSAGEICSRKNCPVKSRTRATEKLLKLTSPRAKSSALVAHLAPRAVCGHIAKRVMQTRERPHSVSHRFQDAAPPQSRPSCHRIHVYTSITTKRGIMIRIARALVLQWFYNGFTVVGPVRGFLHSRRLWFYNGFTLVLQWSDPCGKFYTAPALVLQWFYNGFTLVLQWLYTGVALRAPCLRLA